MHLTPFLPALVGGLLIGAAASLLLLLKGRVAGISGILGGLLRPRRGDISWRAFFVIGMMLAPFAAVLYTGQFPEVAATVSDRLIVAAGLLVGFGSRLGGGCTSGHGVCGLGRRSKRSLVATLTFMAAGFGTVLVMRHLLGGAP